MDGEQEARVSRDLRERRYAERVGEKLRRLRQDRSFSLERLLELADLYGLSPTTLLEMEDEEEFQGSLGGNRPLRIQLQHLDRLNDAERRPLENYLQFLKNLRNDPARQLLTIRKDDLNYISSLYGVRPHALQERLKSEGILE